MRKTASCDLSESRILRTPCSGKCRDWNSPTCWWSLVPTWPVYLPQCPPPHPAPGCSRHPEHGGVADGRSPRSTPTFQNDQDQAAGAASSGCSPMPQGSTAGRRTTTWPCLSIEIRNRSADSRYSRRTYIAGSTGLRPAASTPWRWRPLACNGSRLYEILEQRGFEGCARQRSSREERPGVLAWV